MFFRRRYRCPACCQRKAEIYRCYCEQYIEVPMSIYHGPGYSEADSLSSASDGINEINDTLRAMLRTMR